MLEFLSKIDYQSLAVIITAILGVMSVLFVKYYKKFQTAIGLVTELLTMVETSLKDNKISQEQLQAIVAKIVEIVNSFKTSTDTKVLPKVETLLATNFKEKTTPKTK